MNDLSELYVQFCNWYAINNLIMFTKDLIKNADNFSTAGAYLVLSTIIFILWLITHSNLYTNMRISKSPNNYIKTVIQLQKRVSLVTSSNLSTNHFVHPTDLCGIFQIRVKTSLFQISGLKKL